MLRRAADLAYARPRRVLGATIAVFVVCIVFGGPVAGLLSTGDDFADPGSESEVTAERIEDATGRDPSPAVVALVDLPGPVEAAPASARLAEVAGLMAADPDVAEVAGFHQTGERSFVSADGHFSYLAAFLAAGADEEDVGERLEDALAGTEGVRLGGSAIAGPAVGEQVSKDLARAELLAFPILFLLSLWVFRGFVAALLPLFVGVLAIFGTFLGLRLVNEATLLSIYALNLAIALGLGLAIDYSLFIVSRYREELARSGPGREALQRTLATAGRTIVFSSLTVAAALLSLTIFPQRFLYSMGISGALTALVAASVSLIVLPALLALLGERVNALSPARWRRADELGAQGGHGFWYRLARWVMGRAGAVALVTTLVMLLLAAPFLRIEFTGVDASVLPESAEARQVDTALQTEFESEQTEPLVVVVDGPPGALVRRYARGLAGMPGVADVSGPHELRDGASVIEVSPQDPPSIPPAWISSASCAGETLPAR